MAADIVLNADAVGQVITYVAPGFLARAGYRLRYPAPISPPAEVLIVSVVFSLPMVAAVNAALPGPQHPTQLGYVAFLLGVSLVVGYLAAVARGIGSIKRLLGKLGYRTQPEGSTYAQTLYKLPDDVMVLVEFKDGKRVRGVPRGGPQHRDDGINELYLVYPEALDDDGSVMEIGGKGVIVPLSEVNNIVLGEDPTNAPPESRRVAEESA